MTIYNMDEAADFVGADIRNLNYVRNIFDLKPPPRPTPNATPVLSIISTVCETFQISQMDLCSSRQNHVIAQPRQIAYWLCRHLTKASHPEIARMMGNRHHTTIIHGIANVNKWISEGTPLGRAALRLKAQLGQRA